MTKRENPQVTIGNLRRELNNRDVRINDLISVRDNYQRLANEREKRIAELSTELAEESQWRKADVERLQDMQANYARLDAEFTGYRQAVADMVKP